MTGRDAAFAERYGPWALVAGASDGIGESFAHELARRGLGVVLLARREAVLSECAAAIEREHGVATRVLAVDLTSADLAARVRDATDDLEVGLLVYNAGAVHGARKLVEQPVEHALGLIDLNCRGPVLLAHHFGGRMVERGRGGIVLATSVAALCGSSYTAAYAATKSFDLILAESLWHELAPCGVDVLAAIIGATRTPSMLASNPGFDSYEGIMEPDDVAREAVEHLGRGPSWVVGEDNRAAARGLSPVPRVPLINAMSAATAGLYGLPHTEVPGESYQDESPPTAPPTAPEERGRS